MLLLLDSLAIFGSLCLLARRCLSTDLSVLTTSEMQTSLGVRAGVTDLGLRGRVADFVLDLEESFAARLVTGTVRHLCKEQDLALGLDLVLKLVLRARSGLIF